MRRLLPIFLIILLVLAVIPYNGFATMPDQSKEPIIHFLSINQSSQSPVQVEEGQVDYSMVVESFSLGGKAKVSFRIKNLSTNEVTTIFADQWLLSMQPNSGKFTLTEGTWEATVTAVDENGKQADPYSIMIQVAKQGEVNYKIATVNPDPILIKAEDEIVTVTVSFQNQSDNPQTADVAWRWEDEASWNDRKTVTLPSRFQNQGIMDVTFTFQAVMQGKLKRNVVFVINPDNNPVEKVVSVEFDYPNLSVVKIIIKGTEENKIYADILVEQEALPGRTKTISTDLRYGVDGITQGTTNVTLAPGEMKWITNVVLTKTAPFVEIFAEINYQRNKPIMETDWEYNYRRIQANANNVNLYVSYVSGGTYNQGDTITTVVTVGNIPGSNMDKPVDVVLKRGNTEIGRRSVHMNPGEERNIVFNWTAPIVGDYQVTYDLHARINLDPKVLDEITYDDNEQSANVILNPNFIRQKPCSPGSNNTSAISGYYEYYYNCGPFGCSIGVAPYYEYITVTQTQPTPNPVKAGMGFSYEVQTTYYNENPHNGSNHDFQRVYADFPEGDGFILVPQYNTPNNSNTWKLPRAKIQRGQGDLEMIEYIQTLNPLSLDPTKYVDGGNKHYTSFYMKDGPYSYRTYANGAGVDRITYTDIDGNTWVTDTVQPRLSICMENSLTISGSPHDDYVSRRVNPNNPFPQHGLHGWNWSGYQYIFSNIAPWWNTWGRQNANSIPEQKWYIDVH